MALGRACQFGLPFDGAGKTTAQQGQIGGINQQFELVSSSTIRTTGLQAVVGQREIGQ
jgi:hypothetical protein